MIRPVTCISVVLAAASGLYMYHVKHRTQLLDKQIVAVQHQAVAARERTRLLRAEWALLNDPARLQQLADHYLQLKPMLPQQFVQMANLASRLPAPVAHPAPAPAAPADQGVPVATAAPSTLPGNVVASDATAPGAAAPDATTPDAAQPALVADTAAAVAAELAATSAPPPPPMAAPQDVASGTQAAPIVRPDPAAAVAVAHRAPPRPARTAIRTADAVRSAPLQPPVRRHNTQPLIAEAVAAPRAARYVPTSAREEVPRRVAEPAAPVMASALGMGQATLAPPVPVGWPPRGH